MGDQLMNLPVAHSWPTQDLEPWLQSSTKLRKLTVDFDTSYQGAHSTFCTWGVIFHNCGISVADGKNLKLKQHKPKILYYVTEYFYF